MTMAVSGLSQCKLWSRTLSPKSWHKDTHPTVQASMYIWLNWMETQVKETKPTVSVT